MWYFSLSVAASVVFRDVLLLLSLLLVVVVVVVRLFLVACTFFDFVKKHVVYLFPFPFPFPAWRVKPSVVSLVLNAELHSTYLNRNSGRDGAHVD